jgi:hypothetical protein
VSLLFLKDNRSRFWQFSNKLSGSTSKLLLLKSTSRKFFPDFSSATASLHAHGFVTRSHWMSLHTISVLESRWSFVAVSPKRLSSAKDFATPKEEYERTQREGLY